MPEWKFNNPQQLKLSRKLKRIRQLCEENPHSPELLEAADGLENLIFGGVDREQADISAQLSIYPLR